MNIVILDPSKNFRRLAIIDLYKSFIWTDRFNKCGDFEGYFPMTKENYDLFKIGYYLQQSNSEHTMVIESVEIKSDYEEGDYFVVKGRSLESLLDRRIIKDKVTFDNTSENGLQSAVISLVSTALGENAISERKIDGFTTKSSTDSRIRKLTLQSQYDGDNLYEIITAICEDAKIGFKVILNSNYKYVFELYKGVDHSFKNKTVEKQVIFSPNFDNIYNSDYVENSENYKNFAYIYGEDVKDSNPAKKRTATCYNTASLPTGLNRREMKVEASDVSSPDSENPLPDAKYIPMLQQRGKEELKDYKISRTFDGEVESDGVFKYNVDFKMGDIVTFLDAYGNNKPVRVDEFIMSDDIDGSKSYPSFNVMDD